MRNLSGLTPQFHVEPVIIAGSRGINSVSMVEKAVKDSGFNITEVVSGMCPDSPDMAGMRWALLNSIPVKRFPADWMKGGKGAGFTRNTEMANYADALIAIWDDKSRGTRHMIRTAKEKQLRVFVDYQRRQQ